MDSQTTVNNISNNIQDFIIKYIQIIKESTKNPFQHKLEIATIFTTIGISLYIIKRLKDRNKIIQQSTSITNTISSSYHPSNRYKIPYLNISLNYQFLSSRGLASHMLGGYGLGFVLGISLTSIYFSYHQPLPPSLPTSFPTSNTTKTIAETFLTFTKITKTFPNYHSLANNTLFPLYLYSFNSAIFFTAEYLWSALFHPQNLDFHSFLIYTHSSQLHIAIVSCIVEYIIELKLYPKMKLFSTVNCIGLGVVLGCQLLRTAAEFTAGTNFNHKVQIVKQSDHVLVTHGVYSMLRHPAYFAFFYWSIGSQLLLGNPVCTVAYAVVSWRFFKNRIPFVFCFCVYLCIFVGCVRFEEETLVEFFGEEYEEYRERTYIGIPFI